MIHEFLWTWIPWIYNKTNSVIDITTKIYKSVCKGLNYKKEWVFHYNTMIPIPNELFDTSQIINSKIKWLANTNPPKFRDPNYTMDNWKHISYLSFTVNLLTGNQCDLTDWINDVKWCGFIQPTPLEIFTLWCCELGHSYCFDITGATIEIITEEGDIIKKGLNEFVNTTIYEEDGQH